MLHSSLGIAQILCNTFQLNIEMVFCRAHYQWWIQRGTGSNPWTPPPPNFSLEIVLLKS